MSFSSQLVSALAERLRGQEGQTMAEYALLLGLILVVTAVVVAALGGQISGVFTSVTSAL
ncbi:MAG TPA: Flp family type IVb pilin [Solirubrobacteraceae bacterium]|nr:Flp family type IVb pilin [Solirubrobacteraceae bacterium]